MSVLTDISDPDNLKTLTFPSTYIVNLENSSSGGFICNIAIICASILRNDDNIDRYVGTRNEFEQFHKKS